MSQQLTQRWWEHIVRAIILECDYDAWKGFDPEYNEDGAKGAQQMLDELVAAGKKCAEDYDEVFGEGA